MSETLSLSGLELARNIEYFDNLQHRQLFPRSQWVIEKPGRFTAVGLLVVSAIALLFLLMTWLITVSCQLMC